MGIRNYLVEGGSGAGKTTVAEELERRGYHVIHGDRTLAYYGDPKTGQPAQAPQLDNEADSVRWGYEHWIWPAEQVKALIAERTNPVSFFCGHSANSADFIQLFDGIFFLEVDAETLSQRLSKRPPDEFGGKPIEQELVMKLNQAKADIPPGAVIINSSAPVTHVADEILSRCIAEPDGS